MDEILIEDKRYVSSKRAAKLTGYAKDYVGQLCREGRVPARLVGRSWYVLESAIQDHRFGEAPAEKKEPARRAAPEPSALEKTWESPRYEAAQGAELPAVNRLRDAALDAELAEKMPNDSIEHLEATWQAWFSKIGESPEMSEEGVGAAAAEPDTHPEEETRAVHHPPLMEPAFEPVDLRQAPADETPVPIRAFRDIAPAAAAEDAAEGDENTEAVSIRPRTPARSYRRTIQLAGALIALIAATTAVIGSGYIDSYIISNSQARIFAGVSLYNK